MKLLGRCCGFEVLNSIVPGSEPAACTTYHRVCRWVRRNGSESTFPGAEPVYWADQSGRCVRETMAARAWVGYVQFRREVLQGRERA